MKKHILFLLSIIFSCSSLSYAITPQEAVDRLLAGNKRYMDDKLEHPDRSPDRREVLVSKQKPFVVIVGCSDSRIPPEIVFDQGIGDIFVVRVAGNVVGPLELESVNYAVQVLGSALILVLGHENCGAVDAVFTNQTKDIETIAKLIEPAVQKVKDTPQNNLEGVVKANVSNTANYLKSTPIIKQLMADKKVDILGGYYNLKTGKVEICCPGELTAK